MSALQIMTYTSSMRSSKVCPTVSMVSLARPSSLEPQTLLHLVLILSAIVVVRAQLLAGRAGTTRTVYVMVLALPPRTWQPLGVAALGGSCRRSPKAYSHRESHSHQRERERKAHKHKHADAGFVQLSHHIPLSSASLVCPCCRWSPRCAARPPQTASNCWRRT